MKNITVSVDEDLYRAARIAAAENQTTVSALVRNYLSAVTKGKAPVMAEDDAIQEHKSREELVKLFREANLVLGYKPSREKTYAR